MGGLLSGSRVEKRYGYLEEAFDLSLMLVRIKGTPGEEGQQESSLKSMIMDSDIFILYESELQMVEDEMSIWHACRHFHIWLTWNFVTFISNR